MAAQTQHMVRPMRIFSFAYGLFWTIVGLGVLFFAERNDNNWLFSVLVVFLLGLGLGTVYGSLRLKLEVAEGELRYHGFLSEYRVQLADVSHFSVERYNGGIFFPLNAPASLQIIHVHGDFDPKALDGVVGKEKHVQLVFDYLTAQLGTN